MFEATILIKKSKGVTYLTLNRPDKLNSFNEEMHKALYLALSDAKDDATCGAILLTGSGRAFCAGQDLSDRDPTKIDDNLDLGHTIETYYNPLIRLIRNIEKPVICAVNGVAAGAGANIALICDIVFAAKSAKFIQAFCKIGLIPDSGGTWSLTRLIGEARAKAITMTAMPVFAEQAAQWGMIWQAVDDDKLINSASQMAQQLAMGATASLGMTKQAIQASHINSLDQQLDLECEFQRQAGNSSDYAEGVSAFIEKRQARFSGVK